MKVTGLKKTYGDRVVLNVPELEFERGKIYAITGHNGSGKSTLGKLLARIENADSEVEVDAVNLKKAGLKIGYVAQKPYAFNKSVEKNIRVNANEKNSNDSELKIEYLIKSLKLDAFKKENAKKLSGGETQKMALARAMVKEYDILILDEATSSMDEEATQLSEKLIREYAKDMNAAVVLISHEYDQIQRIADVTYHLDNGCLK